MAGSALGAALPTCSCGDLLKAWVPVAMPKGWKEEVSTSSHYREPFYSSHPMGSEKAWLPKGSKDVSSRASDTLTHFLGDSSHSTSRANTDQLVTTTSRPGGHYCSSCFRNEDMEAQRTQAAVLLHSSQKAWPGFKTKQSTFRVPNLQSDCLLPRPHSQVLSRHARCKTQGEKRQDGEYIEQIQETEEK